MTIALQNAKLVATFQHHHLLNAELQSLVVNRFLATFNDPLYETKVWPLTIEKRKNKINLRLQLQIL